MEVKNFDYQNPLLKEAQLNFDNLKHEYDKKNGDVYVATLTCLFKNIVLSSQRTSKEKIETKVDQNIVVFHEVHKINPSDSSKIKALFLPLWKSITAKEENPSPPILPVTQMKSLSARTTDTLSLSSVWANLRIKTDDNLPEFLSDTEIDKRFPDIDCPRVTAKCLNNKFWHANFLGCPGSNQEFIASQAPVPKDEPLFWETVLEDCSLIVDLTNKRDQLKLNSYFSLNQERQQGSILVKCLEEQRDKFSTLHTFQLQNEFISKKIKRINFSAWPDGGTISVEQLDSLVEFIASQGKLEKVLVHCRAGVGRTGTLITAFYLREKILSKEIRDSNFIAELSNLILCLRKQGMVQKQLKLGNSRR